MGYMFEQETGLDKAGLYFESLSVYRGLLKDRVVDSLYGLAGCFDSGNSGTVRSFVRYYNDFYFELIASGKESLKDYIIEKVLYDDNTFAKKCAEGKEIDSCLEKAASRDLDCLQSIAELTAGAIKAYAKEYFSLSSLEEDIIDNLGEWGECRGSGEEYSQSWSKDNIKSLLSAHERWSECLKDLMNFYKNSGTGMFAKYKAFLWEHSDKGSFLKGVKYTDPVKLSNLIGYSREREVVIENTLQFLDGYPANNILLYGDRGTGKSTTVKAILNEYHTKGLRMIEIPKNNLLDFPLIIRELKDRPQRFIIFVDDLAFEDSEETYTALKAVLEGGLESRPQNVLIYATSNRRHLVKEKFSDRVGLHSGNHDAEVHSADTLQEKLSLADRFGINVVFTSPDQNSYLRIVEGLADQRNIKISREELHREALKWEIWYNGRSPRTARQFVDWLEGHVGR